MAVWLPNMRLCGGNQFFLTFFFTDIFFTDTYRMYEDFNVGFVQDWYSKIFGARSFELAAGPFVGK